MKQVQELLSREADPNLVKFDDLKAGNKNCTALYFAVKNNNHPMITLLQRHGAINSYEESTSAVRQVSPSILGSSLNNAGGLFFNNRDSSASDIQNKEEVSAVITNSN